MKKSFVFNFENSNFNLSRTYKFNLEFSSAANLEAALDWAECTDDISDFVLEMEKYGSHEITYNPNEDFYGFESDEILPKNYIRVMENWKNFFVNHDIDCDDIVEIIN